MIREETVAAFQVVSEQPGVLMHGVLVVRKDLFTHSMLDWRLEVLLTPLPMPRSGSTR